MIVYGDTSGLVKLVIDEIGSDQMDSLYSRADIVAAARIAYAELRAALAALARAGRIARSQLPRVRQEAEEVWNGVSPIEVDSSLVQRAGDLAEEHYLRGYDAVHLAALQRLGEPGGCLLASWDSELRRAARALGYGLYPDSDEAK